MKNIFGNIFKKEAVKPVQSAERPVSKIPAKPKYDFVEQYTVIDPKKILSGGYEMWQMCENVPVACEEEGVPTTGFIRCKMLPTKIVMGFLCELQKKTSEEIKDPKMRTLSIVHISQNHRIVIEPNFESPKSPVFWLVADDAPKKDWILHVTPEKNRAIVDALKIHTR